MSSPRSSGNDTPRSLQDPNPSTVASFSPSSTPTTDRSRKTVLVNQKSPLLIATPPQITRALAFSHPFLLPLNKFVGLITWSSGDPWESFLLVASFWALVLYGDTITRWTGPIVIVIGLILAMYSRRYSPLSSTGWSGEKLKGHKREESEGGVRHRKSLDEIVDTLNVFTSRCNLLLEPFLELTDFLSTQRTATSATTRPALTSLFLRILMVTPIWIVLTLRPITLITSQRVVLAVGTLMLSWHSRPARVSRTILWRSLTIRYVVAVITGLNLMTSPPRKKAPPPLPPRSKSQGDVANSLAVNGKTAAPGVRFTFAIYENQRRWLGLGWTSSMFAYERASWTDEHLNSLPPRDEFKLPTIEGGYAQWMWVPGSDWRSESTGNSSATGSKKPGEGGWIYYDNKWNDGRRQDGWGRYTRRRKWYRDAELVEVAQGSAEHPTELPATEAQVSDGVSTKYSTDQSFVRGKASVSDSNSQLKRRGLNRRNSKASGQGSNHSNRSLFASDDEVDRIVPDGPDPEGDWGVGDDVKMGLG